MALISCPDCGHQISDQAPNCLNCGRQMFTTDGIKVNKQISRGVSEGLKHHDDSGAAGFFLLLQFVICFLIARYNFEFSPLGSLLITPILWGAYTLFASIKFVPFLMTMGVLVSTFVGFNIDAGFDILAGDIGPVPTNVSFVGTLIFWLVMVFPQQHIKDS